MCTVTFIARKHGYALGMNRDEKRTRVQALPPAERLINGRRVICPAEPGGGTWIAANDAGVTFALINWYSITARVNGAAHSRGEVVVAASAVADEASVTERLQKLRLPGINPFRLIGVFPAPQRVVEWRWDLKHLTITKHGWKTQQWISSGFDEPTAQRIRGQTFRAAQRQKTVGRVEWLRRLHRSHAPHIGAFSSCMHRPDAVTVSYTEVSVRGRQIGMLYHASAPCQNAHGVVRNRLVGTCCLMGRSWAAPRPTLPITPRRWARMPRS